MKKHLLLTAAALVLVITMVAATGVHRFVNVRYTDSASPSLCQYPGTLPEDCTETVPGIVCTLAVGTHTLTYYQFSTCTTPWYRPD